MLFMVTNICVAYNCILKFISRCLWKPKFLTFIKTDPVRNRVRIGFYYACRIGILNAAVFQIRSKKKDSAHDKVTCSFFVQNAEQVPQFCSSSFPMVTSLFAWKYFDLGVKQQQNQAELITIQTGYFWTYTIFSRGLQSTVHINFKGFKVHWLHGCLVDP